MAIQTLTIPQRSYPVGTTSGQRALPGTQTYSRADVAIDCSTWTNPATTKVVFSIDFSEDGGTTWRNLGAIGQTSPPPYVTEEGTDTNITGFSWSTGTVMDPTHLRGRVTVTGLAVTLGPVTINAS